MTENESKEEQQWLLSVQNKLKKYIGSFKWDCITLTTNQYDIISQIMKAKDVKDLPISINERITDWLFEVIEKKFKQVKLIKGL